VAKSKLMPRAKVLARRNTKALAATLRRFGVRADVDAITENMVLAAKQLVAAAAPSDALVARTVAALEARGHAEVARIVKDYVRREQRMALGLVDGSRETAVWIAVVDKNTCDDCLGRHGHEATMAEWEAVGLPGSDNLLCDGRCRCDFLRGDMVDERTVDKGDITVEIGLEVD